MNKIKENLVPIAILVAGLFIAAAIVFTNLRVPSQPSSSDSVQPSNNGLSLDSLRPVTEEDWIRGDLNAPIKIIEFSDLECPFCKMFHPTMQTVMRNYQGQVAWVYRHFPLEVLHKKARKEAEAAECVGYLGGNSAFWVFVDRIFEVTPSNDGLDLSLLPELAEEVGVNRENFERCLNDGTYADKVQEDLEEAFRIGLRGTPTSILIAPNGEQFVISGAQPYSQIKDLIEQVLQNQ